MGARERLEQRLRIALPEDSAAAAIADLDAYAHELAEKIREHTWRECCGAGCSDLPEHAADLIDPEVEQ